MSVILLPRRSQKNWSNSTTVVMALSYTPWMPAISATHLKALVEVVERTTNYEVALAIQTATADPDAPDAWTALGTYTTATGRTCQGLFDIRTLVDSKFWFRAGLLSRNTSGTALESADVALTVTLRG